MKFDVESIFDSLNIYTIRINNQNIINIKRNDDICLRVDEHIIVSIDESEVLFFYKFDEGVISNSRWLF